MDQIWQIAVAAVLGSGSGLLVPSLIARIPEPQPDQDHDVAVEPASDHVADPTTGPASGSTDGPVKTPYVDIAAVRHLGLICALLGALAGGLIGWRLDFGWPYAAWLTFVPIAIALGVIDLRTKLLPSYLIKPTYFVLVALIIMPLVVAGDWATVKQTALGWLAYGGFFFVLWLIHPRGMGYGDVRLAGLLGILTGRVGWAEVITTFYGTFLIGPIVLLVVSGLAVRKKQVPFGPFMLLGAWVGLVLGRTVLGPLGA